MPLQLSEWMSLDEQVRTPPVSHPLSGLSVLIINPQTKMAHCVRVASQSLPPGQTAPYPAQLEVKRRYEMGEWSVPCYSLQCVGFNTALYDALCAATSAVSEAPSTARPSPNPIVQPTSACRDREDSVVNGPRRKSSGCESIASTLRKKARLSSNSECDPQPAPSPPPQPIMTVPSQDANVPAS